MEDEEDKHILVVEGTWHMYMRKHTHVLKKQRMYV